MQKESALRSISCFVDYLTEWADLFDRSGYSEVADGITHVATHLARESAQIDPVHIGNERESQTR